MARIYPLDSIPRRPNSGECFPLLSDVKALGYWVLRRYLQYLCYLSSWSGSSTQHEFACRPVSIHHGPDSIGKILTHVFSWYRIWTENFGHIPQKWGVESGPWGIQSGQDLLARFYASFLRYIIWLRFSKNISSEVYNLARKVYILAKIHWPYSIPRFLRYRIWPENLSQILYLKNEI